MKPIEYRKRFFYGEQLQCGFKTENISFGKKSDEDLQRIVFSMWEHGMVNPFVTFESKYILVGINRFRVLTESRIPVQNPLLFCLDIVEDVRLWGREDVDRLQEFKEKMFAPVPDYKEKWDI